MPFAPVPSADEIVRLYEAGELAAELARYHEGDNGEEAFLQRCVSLHNEEKIDLIELPAQPAFAQIERHGFFTALSFYCDAIPDLRGDVAGLMECCRILLDLAAGDGAASCVNSAFRRWCQINRASGDDVIRRAKAGDALGKQFLTFVLQGTNDVRAAIDFITSYEDDRRLSGIWALAGVEFSDANKAKEAFAIVEPLVSAGNEDSVRCNALVSAFEILKKHNDPQAVDRLVEAAMVEPGPSTLYSLAQVLWLFRALLSSSAIAKLLRALEAVLSEHQGTVRLIDTGLRHLLETETSENEGLAMGFLSAKLQDERFSIESFGSTAALLKRENAQRRYELIVRWLLSGDLALASNVRKLVGIDSEPFDSAVQPVGLTAAQQKFLCRKAIGFLFPFPKVCCSILLSVLRLADKGVEREVVDLLLDPLLLSYGGQAKDFLKSIPKGDAAYKAVQKALKREKEFYAGLEATGIVKELHPSDYQRDVVAQRIHDEMRDMRKMAERESIFLNFVQRSTILYGMRSLNYVMDQDGNRRAVTMDLQAIGRSIELPRLDILDPVRLDYIQRLFCLEKPL